MDLPEFLQTTSAFEGFAKDELEVLEKALRVDHFPAGQILQKEGGMDHAVYIVMEGQVALSHRHGTGHGIDELGVLQSGDVFGYQSLISGSPRYSSCRSLTPVQLASLPATAFNFLYNSHVKLAEHFQFLIARQLVREMRQLDRAIAVATHEGQIEPLHPLL